MSETASEAKGQPKADASSISSGSGGSHPREEQQGEGRKTNTGAMVAAGLGGLVVAAAITFVISGGLPTKGPEGQSMLSQVAQSEVGDALATMPGVAAAVAEEAKSCKTPLANITLVNAPGTTGRMVRVRSGAYLSAPFMLSDTPQRIAIPFPAAYPVGSGTIVIEGAAAGTGVTLYPTFNVNTTTGTQPINVWWTPKKSC